MLTFTEAKMFQVILKEKYSCFLHWGLWIWSTIQGCWKVLNLNRRETNYNDRRFRCSYFLFIIVIGGILVLFIYITSLVSKEIFSPSNKIHWEVGRAKDLSAPLYLYRGARPGRKQATATEVFDVHISYLKS